MAFKLQSHNVIIENALIEGWDGYGVFAAATPGSTSGARSWVTSRPPPPKIAALLLTRVISRPAADLITFDLGYRACASDPPLERRLLFPDLPDARLVRQNEEHLLIRSRTATHLQPGDCQMAVPWHICPTVALHRRVDMIEGGRVAERWDVMARDRWLTI